MACEGLEFVVFSCFDLRCQSTYEPAAAMVGKVNSMQGERTDDDGVESDA